MGGESWLDRFTGTRYTYGAGWSAAVRRHLADRLRARGLDGDAPESSANKAAGFWSDEYYRLLFPLRFQRGVDGQGAIVAAPALPATAAIDLEPLAGPPLRQGFLADGLPPILADPRRAGGEAGWLLADRLLIEAALLNALLWSDPAVSDVQRHAARLAALTYPFHDDVPELGRGAHGALVTAIGAVLGGSDAELPAPLRAAVLAVRERQVAGRPVRLALVAAQRIKQYVFDTPGLNEIRGGSTLLDQITGELRRRVARELGPEMVLRAAGSTLLFLVPAGEPTDWPAELRRAFYAHTGGAFPAAAAIEADAQELLDSYGAAIARLNHAANLDRARAERPLVGMLPFETRCALCGTRPAEGWDVTPGLPEDERVLPQNQRPLCRVCCTKRVIGQDQRAERARALLQLLDPANTVPLDALGITPGELRERIADELGELIPPAARRRLIGVVYGDGNNFGAVSQGLADVALGIQWVARVQHTTAAAAALALAYGARAANPGAPFDFIPFQPLALGGDDVSLFAWGPVALHFAAEFARLTDLELATSADAGRVYDRPLTFSLGVLITDEKTPVRKSVDFAEEQLLKWAKRVARGDSGRIAMLYAQTAESVPADLKRYRAQVYALGSRRLRLHTTLRPYTAADLRKLLAIAGDLVARGDSGRLQRLAAALYNRQQGVLAGLLHYAYQRGRETARGRRGAPAAGARAQPLRPLGDETIDDGPDRPAGWIAHLEDALAEAEFGPRDAASQLFFAPAYAAGARFSPLWDLVELVKIVS